MARIPRSSPKAESTRAERYRAGKALRQRVPRSLHAEWVPSKERPDPVSLVREADRHRVSRLLPIRYGRMSISPFTFYRGAAVVMASDLSTTPSIGSSTQLCGDAHMANFGVLATPERDEVFDISDFDETLPGPWEWDVKRLVTSLVLVARQNGFSAGDARRAARGTVRAYRELMSDLAQERYLDVWYAHLDLEGLPDEIDRLGRKMMESSFRAARRRTGFHAFPRWAEKVRGGYRIREDRPLIQHYASSADEAPSVRFYESYVASLPEERRVLLQRYHVEDVAQKVVGVGSVGTVCSVILLMGDEDVTDPLFLQVKEANASALEAYLAPSVYSNHAERVVVGQHLVQEASDIFLGWSRSRGRDFYIRQLRDMKYSTEFSSLGPKALASQGSLCGAAMARAHARSGDPALIAGYLGDGDVFDRAVAEFGERYADQTALDHALLVKAIRRGEVAVARNV